MWFVYGEHPIRFSLREFGILTGLICGPLPSDEEESSAIDVGPISDSDFFHTLIGPNNSYTIREIVDILKEDKKLPIARRMNGDRRLRLCLVVIVDEIFICNSFVVRASSKVVKLVENLDAFVKYPWGRLSFLRTLERVTLGYVVPTARALADQLSQSHTATHGFTLSFQLLFFHAIPLLARILPDADDELTFDDRSMRHLTQLNLFHNSNILEAENNPNLCVENILHSEDPQDYQDYNWYGTEVDNTRIDLIMRKLDDGHIFKKKRLAWRDSTFAIDYMRCAKKENNHTSYQTKEIQSCSREQNTPA
ncbi:PREDICTED: uncharacterized protein LOC104702538 isoform X1 [Camelina sativa]|uniref:Uncharacterized protein LOC104702538 isoform X1 n=1 Tax=Camelina sativa TaxID=90675 RepID=A0ABM0SVG0_CAMSA|nr:PREDICTED: uncharacterized protein LOC104702538 isoform X1 [Camelina sativa]